MKERIQYIDSAKGIAIILVVMGHVVAWQYPQFYEALEEDSDNKLLLWKLIYAFHMPLFMFLSGLFHTKVAPSMSFSTMMTKIFGRAKMLMLPYIVMGCLYWYVSGRQTFFWFLLTAFEFYVINIFISFIASRTKHQVVIEAICHLAVCCAFFLACRYLKEYECLPLLDIGHLENYWYYVAGYYVMRNSLLDIIVRNTKLYAASFAVFVVLFCVSLRSLHLPLDGIVRAFCAIVCFIFLSKRYFDNHGLVTKLFQWLGRHSLEIYVLHYFFAIKLCGCYLIDYAYSIGGGISAFAVSLIMTTVITIANLLICGFFIKILKASPVLAKFSFGRA